MSPCLTMHDVGRKRRAGRYGNGNTTNKALHASRRRRRSWRVETFAGGTGSGIRVAQRQEAIRKLSDSSQSRLVCLRHTGCEQPASATQRTSPARAATISGLFSGVPRIPTARMHASTIRLCSRSFDGPCASLMALSALSAGDCLKPRFNVDIYTSSGLSAQDLNTTSCQ